MGRTIQKHTLGKRTTESAVTDTPTRYTVVEKDDDYTAAFVVRYGKSASQSAFQTSPTVKRGDPFVVLAFLRGTEKQQSSEQLSAMRPRDALLYALSIVESVDALMPMCTACNGNGSISHDEAPAGEHATREETCDACKGEGRVLA